MKEVRYPPSWLLYAAGLGFVSPLILLALMGQVTTDMPAVKVSAIPGEFCKTIEVPAADEEFYTVWRAPRAATLTEIYCEVDDGGGTSVVFDFEVDDGSPEGVSDTGATDVTCLPAASGGTTDSSLDGDSTMAAGHRLDIDLGAVNGDVDLFSACIRFTLD